jgi:hypothetical protein
VAGSYTDVRIIVDNDADWVVAHQMMQSLSDTFGPARPLSKGVWHYFRPDGLNQVPVTLGVWLAGDVKPQVQARIAAMPDPRLRDHFRILVEEDNA